MKSITFVSLERHYYDRHQFYCLAAYLKSKGFDVSYISGHRFDKVIERIKSDKPDLLGYSSFSGNAGTYVEFDKFQKNRLGIKSIIGGPASIFDPEAFAKTTIDAVCIGEGEAALAQYLESDGKSAGNVVIGGDMSSVKLNMLDDLADLPFPDREIVYKEEPYLKNMKYRFFLSGRGCPFHCSYCHNNIFNKRFKDCGKIVRKKPVSHFIEEVREVVSKYDTRLIIMHDDTFIVDKPWLAEFCGEYKKKIKRPFACNIRANIVDEDTVRQLKDASCVSCVWGIESGNDDIRNRVLKRGITQSQIINTADLLHKYGIRFRIGNIIGIPDETYDNIKDTIELNIRCKPRHAIAGTLVPYPNLEIADYAIRTGSLDPEKFNNLPNIFWTKSILNFSQSEKERILKTSFLFPLFVLIPVFYKNAILRKAMYRMPAFFLKYLHALLDMYGMSRVYPFKATFGDAFNIATRYFKYSAGKE